MTHATVLSLVQVLHEVPQSGLLPTLASTGTITLPPGPSFVPVAPPASSASVSAPSAVPQPGPGVGASGTLKEADSPTTGDAAVPAFLQVPYDQNNPDDVLSVFKRPLRVTGKHGRYAQHRVITTAKATPRLHPRKIINTSKPDGRSAATRRPVFLRRNLCVSPVQYNKQSTSGQYLVLSYYALWKCGCIVVTQGKWPSMTSALGALWYR
jgi:hypothetical protein